MFLYGNSKFSSSTPGESFVRLGGLRTAKSLSPRGGTGAISGTQRRICETVFSCFFMGIVVLASSSYLWASGYFIYHQDAKAHGQAGAFTAQADNPSAIYYNPAGMSQLDGTQVRLGTEFVRLETEYKNLQGLKQDLEAELAVVPNFYITSDFGSEKLTGGLGVYAPFGLGTSWSDEGLLRYICTDTGFYMVNINPALAYELFPEFSVALGADYYNVYSYINKLKKNFVLADADVKLDADGDGWGFNLGCLWKPHPKHSLGLSYRSRVDVELSGDLKYRDIPLGLGYPSSITYNVSQDMTLPSVVNAGYAFRPIDKLKLELDLYWLEWSTIDKAEIKDKDTGALLSVTDADWDNTWIIAVGGEYLINPQWAVRAGYCYQQNAVPEKTFNPNLPDSDIHVIALGLGYSIKRVTVDIAYSIAFCDERDIDNTVGASVGSTVDGTYDSLVHVIGASLGYKF